ncbi:hypothetical protein BC628DRAFT_174756 [Trametes gibbosa]|nr:hypothetical protein BC628DRAFT_174756 [Trametes gibbosa]
MFHPRSGVDARLYAGVDSQRGATTRLPHAFMRTYSPTMLPARRHAIGAAPPRREAEGPQPPTPPRSGRGPLQPKPLDSATRAIASSSQGYPPEACAHRPRSHQTEATGRRLTRVASTPDSPTRSPRVRCPSIARMLSGAPLCWCTPLDQTSKGSVSSSRAPGPKIRSAR